MVGRRLSARPIQNAESESIRIKFPDHAILDDALLAQESHGNAICRSYEVRAG